MRRPPARLSAEDQRRGLEAAVQNDYVTQAGGAPWGDAALAVCQRLLGGSDGAPPELAGLALFSLRAIPANKRLDIRWTRRQVRRAGSR